MKSNRFVLNPLVEEEFTLIAILSSYEDYRLAFSINKNLNLNLKRRRKDLDVVREKKNISYPIFEHQDPFSDTCFFLVGNKFISYEDKVTSAGSLFIEHRKQSTVLLVPELKNADYLLKITSETPDMTEQKTVSKLLKLPSVITAYSVDQEKLKEKKNLNFD